MHRGHGMGHKVHSRASKKSIGTRTHRRRHRGGTGGHRGQMGPKEGHGGLGGA